MEMDDKNYLKWMISATDSEKRLRNKVLEFSDYFDDMLFLPGNATGKMINCQIPNTDGDWVDGEVPLPDELKCFSYNFFSFYVSKLNRKYAACFDEKSQSLTVDEKYLNDYGVILHEMIHLHEFVVNQLPFFYHDTLLWCLYKNLCNKVTDLDKRISNHGHLFNEQDLLNRGGLHDILFLLKSFDLDLQMGYPLGTVFGYGLYEAYAENK